MGVLIEKTVSRDRPHIFKRKQLTNANVTPYLQPDDFDRELIELFNFAS
jgi:hypothetical protein